MKVDSTPQLEEDDEFEEFDTEGVAAPSLHPAVSHRRCATLPHFNSLRTEATPFRTGSDLLDVACSVLPCTVRLFPAASPGMECKTKWVHHTMQNGRSSRRTQTSRSYGRRTGTTTRWQALHAVLTYVSLNTSRPADGQTAVWLGHLKGATDVVLTP